MRQPDIRPIKESGDLYRLNENYPFEFRGKSLIIPINFLYDGASGARLLFQRDGIHRAAALVHDWLYVHQGTLPDKTKYTRKQADQLFRDMLLQYGVKSVHVWVAYQAVRIAGRFYWNE